MSELTQVSQVMGPYVLLAARVKEALEAHPSNTMVETEWGNFFVRRIELAWTDGHITESGAVLVPDEGDGKTFDLYTLEPDLSDKTPKELDGDTSILPCIEGEEVYTKDWAALKENVRGHTLARFFSHPDGRVCGYHQRLGVWTFNDTMECLREHPRDVNVIKNPKNPEEFDVP